MGTTTTIAKVKIDTYAIAAYTPEMLTDLVAENLEGDTLSLFDLPRAKIPAGGGLRWSVPSISGGDDADPTEVQGVIIHKALVRSYWEGDIDATGGGASPDCESEDSRVGVGTPGGACAECSMARFGSRGAGQACKQLMRVFLLEKESLLPMMIHLPPTSIKAMRGYLTGLLAQGRYYRRVVTSLALEKATNKAGIAYARVAATMVGALDDDAAGIVQSYADAIRPALSQRPVSGTEYATSE